MATTPEDSVGADDERTPYERVEHRIGRILDVEKTEFLLFWDTDVMMPPDGEPARSSQQSTLNALRHELLADPWLGEALDAVDESSLSDGEAAVVREVSREHAVAARIPDDLNEELGRVTGEAFGAWKRARASDDFEAFVPHFRRHVDLRREWGRHAAPAEDAGAGAGAGADADADANTGANPYHALWEQAVGYHSQAYVPYETVDRVFDRLREELVPLIEAVRESDVEPGAGVFEGTFDEETQLALTRDALDLVGLDWDRARLDTATHPFSYGSQFDVRITTRFDEENPVDGLTSTLHEFGHTDYTLGLRDEAYGTPLGEPRGLAVHESQSRLWENHVARSEAFWEAFLPTMAERFPSVADVTPREAYEAANRVDPTNLIRVEADELTYHMHIILRTEIERDLVSGDLDVEDVPRVWDEKMDEYLGVTPDTDAEGCLQDIHWSKTFPGFISYTLGSVLAAQFWHAATTDVPDLEASIAAGEFDPLHDWLETNVQSPGQRYPTDELVERATGEPLNEDYFVDYVTEKFTDLYDL
jgi:carboxypeptidase Taq